MAPLKIYLEHSGCTRRKIDVSKFHQYFLANGYKIVGNPRKADSILVSTCAFKKEEEEYSISRVAALQKYNGKLVVYGCLPEIAPNRFESLFPDVPFISPKNIKTIDSYFENISTKYEDLEDAHNIPLEFRSSSFRIAVDKFFKIFEFSPLLFTRVYKYLVNKVKNKTSPSPERYYLYAGRGCLGTCTYCAIRKSVGSVQSLPLEKVRSDFFEGLKLGYKDFVLLGDDVGSYGMDIGSSFPKLISELFEALKTVSESIETDKVSFHIEEIHPIWILKYEKELLELIATKRIKSLLCPIQSGSSRVLEAMSRQHSGEIIVPLIEKIRKANPDILLTSQILVGFPSETEDEFQETLDVVTRANFEVVTVFPYDEKENTPSANIEPKISQAEIDRRTKKAITYLKRNGIHAYLSCSMASIKITELIQNINCAH